MLLIPCIDTCARGLSDGPPAVAIAALKPRRGKCMLSNHGPQPPAVHVVHAPRNDRVGVEVRRPFDSSNVVANALIEIGEGQELDVAVHGIRMLSAET